MTKKYRVYQRQLSAGEISEQQRMARLTEQYVSKLKLNPNYTGKHQNISILPSAKDFTAYNDYLRSVRREDY